MQPSLFPLSDKFFQELPCDISVNASSRAVMERVGLTYVRTFPTSMTAPVEGVEEGEVEYEMTREQWERRATFRCDRESASRL